MSHTGAFAYCNNLDIGLKLSAPDTTDAIQREYRHKTEKNSPIQQLSRRYKRRMPVRISIRPKRQQNENLKKIGNRDSKVVVLCIAFRPILDLGNTKEQEHQSVYEICPEQIRPAIDSTAEKKSSPRSTACNYAKRFTIKREINSSRYAQD